MGNAVGGLIGWTADPAPSADPASLRALFDDLGVPVAPGAAALEAEVRTFQAHVGLAADGVAGPQTVHALARYAEEARDLRIWGGALAAAPNS
ncbi:peptidoglycan-binding domain-containing protein [Actinoplanes sp. NPDC051470]|uniref:peptidoglycan-binding domain-containing protein n=1 Tax=unclassified Actinoplanes TaxID=2626549 RepID=UPI0034371506